MSLHRIPVLAALTLGLPLLPLCVLQAAPVPVGLSETDGSWKLTRAGSHYQINGAGGPAPLEKLAALGGNSTRVWGFDQLEDGRLDDAHRNGITVAVGIWLRHDLDYNDPGQVASQIKLALDGVRKYKDHPAVLVWGIGNEMEGTLGDNPAVWHHVESIAKKIKAIDPHHPTMTVLAEMGGDKIRHLHKLCPNIDIVGINSYGGAASVPKRYRENGGSKPYILTEFGPRGPFDFGKNDIGSVDEEFGKIKAATYLETHQTIMADTTLCLGSYAFMWGHKQEATPTWFGMFLADGRKTLAVDVMTTRWTGKPPANRCPQINSLSLPRGTILKTGATLTVQLKAEDPDGDALDVDWVLMQDAQRHLTAGYFQETPPSYKKNILAASATAVTFRVPSKPGLYRIFAYVGDKNGAADVANIVFRAE
ncbi:MAG: glycoside hydrolase family 2 TIM barrel-domain containing protein [Verrucomicrobiales bacterium]|nr:glycoside hydrolase family 2 TIM barrel-domain containing protein [Verrucomicrobiales bacterium]